MENANYDVLKLKNQLCFPLYACAKEIVRRYKPLLDRIDLTYTQYIVMMVVWEEKAVTVKELGRRLFLDSGTLTPVLKTLEGKGFLKRERLPSDERNLLVTVTESGAALRARACTVPAELADCVPISQKDAEKLYEILYRILGGLSANGS